jgi:excisionase family DNA binding protein
MRTFTLAEAARLIGTSRGTLYRAIKAGRLICTSAGGPGKESVITEDALRQAGYQLPGDATQLERSRVVDGSFYSTSHDTSHDTSRLIAVEQRIEHLERYVERLDAKVDLALDLLKAWAGQHAPTPVLPTPAAVAIPRRTPARPLSAMRQRIVDLLRQHPEGMSPAQVRQALRIGKDLGDTMGGMARDGLLTRVEAGRYRAV